MSEPLALYDAARSALAKARNIDEVQSIRDQAAVLRAYARQAKDRGLEVDAAEIRLRAERKLGEILAAQKELPREQGGGMNRGRPGPGRGKAGAPAEPALPDATPTLAELGIDKKLSARSQRLASIPEAKFDQQIAEWRNRVEDGSESVTSDTAKVMEPAARSATTPPPRRRHREMASDVAWRELWAWRNRNGNLAIFRQVFDVVDGLRPQFMKANGA